MRVGSLFSGIGGLDLGLERAGMTVTWQSEIDPYCAQVLAKHWPTVPNLGDVTQVDWQEVEPVDLIVGGFPCQPVSLAGRRQGQDDERWLWPEYVRAVRVLRPRWVLVENVPGLLVRGMGDVLGDLATCGYMGEWDCIPAAAVGAPHLRYRVFIVAHTSGAELREQPGWRDGQSRARSPFVGVDGASRTVADADASGRDGRAGIFGPRRRGQLADGGRGDAADPDSVQADGSAITWQERSHWAVEPDVGRVAHGISRRVDRLRALGNAVVPQVAEWIGRRIMVADADRTRPQGHGRPVESAGERSAAAGGAAEGTGTE